MAIPSGSGSEVLRRGAVQPQSTDVTSFKFDGTNPATGTETYAVPANHIITIISVIFCEGSGAAETVSMNMTDGTNAYVVLLETHALAARDTFVWSDKFSFNGFGAAAYTEPMNSAALQTPIAQQGGTLQRYQYIPLDADVDCDIHVSFSAQNNA